MSNKIKHRRYFIYGISAGFIAGFITAIIAYRYNYVIEDKISSIRFPGVSITGRIAENTNENKEAEKVEEHKIKRKNKYDKKESQIPEEDSINNLSEEINIISDTNKIDKKSEEEENIVVINEELLSSKEIKLYAANEKIIDLKEQNLRESLTGERRQNNTEKIIIEFWKSPLNYQGYKYLSNKLFIYGIIDFDNVDFYFYNNSLYAFKPPDIYYEFVKTNHFKPLSIVNDEELIEELKRISDR